MRIIGDRMIEIKNLNKSFGEQIIFNQANLKLEENEISVFLGKSGEGKSTLFRIIMGLEDYDSGEFNFNTNRFGMVFQNYELYPHLTVLNNLIVPQRVILKREKKEAKEKAIKILRELNIEEIIDKTVLSLSGGESQRLAIARTLVMDNTVLLMDEPTSALDQENVTKLIELLKILSKTTTILIITHDIMFAKDVADTIYKISENKIVKHSLN